MNKGGYEGFFRGKKEWVFIGKNDEWGCKRGDENDTNQA